MLWICPLCQHPLTSNANGVGCPSRHQFDRAKEGYVNLLPVQHKNSKNPGDNPAMIAARRHFLTAGHYQPLANAIEQLLPREGVHTLLDIGCGEGYYSQFISQHRPNCLIYGIDISKAAVKAAAKSAPGQHFAVASAYQLPLADASMDAMLRVYAPSDDQQMHRVLKPGGYLLTVTPAPEHLLQFKQRVYAEVRLHDEQIATVQGMHHHTRQRLSWRWQADDAQSLLALLEMIPLAYKFDQAKRDALATELPAIQLDFYLDLYQRQHPAAL